MNLDFANVAAVERCLRMIIKKILIAAIVVFSYPACSGGGAGGSGGSGVPSAKRISDLTSQEGMEICAWAAEVQGGENQIFTCTDDTTVETGSVEECIMQMEAWPECDVTVDSLEACGLAIANDACNSISTSGCQALISCSVP